MKTPMNVKVIVGANYGDEGKGQVVDYFVRKAFENNKDSRALVVLPNGGAQRGHTVQLKNGVRHVFHHIGSGTFVLRSDTFLTDEFIVNPMLFNKEFDELEKLGLLKKFTWDAEKEVFDYEDVYKNNSVVFMDSHCRVSTPFDMLLNQILEENRGENRHGSCGIGIFTTIKRCEKNRLTLDDYYTTDEDGQRAYIMESLQYLKDQLKENDITELKLWQSEIIIHPESTIEHFMEDLFSMYERCIIVDNLGEVLKYNENVKHTDIIFEMGQGLKLDMNRTFDFPHLTPSNTTARSVAHYISKYLIFPYDCFGNGSIELVYVTRTYLTRHGAGNFSEECTPEDLNIVDIDKTNVPNDFQGSIRYSKFTLNEFYQMSTRITFDWKCVERFFPITKSLFVTHLNESDEFTNKQLFNYFNHKVDRYYTSDKPYND